MAPARRRRSVPWLLAGVALVLGCALAFAVTALRLGGRDPVLAVTHAVPAGHVITAADLRVTQVAAPDRLKLISADARARVTGRTAAVPLTAGALLTEAALGQATYPPGGQAVTAVALKPGQFPPSLAPGSRVAVVISPTSPTATTGSSGRQRSRASVLEATVTGMRPVRGQAAAGTVVSLRMGEQDATAVAAASADTVSLVLLPPRQGGSR